MRMSVLRRGGTASQSCSTAEEHCCWTWWHIPVTTANSRAESLGQCGLPDEMVSKNQTNLNQLKWFLNKKPFGLTFLSNLSLTWNSSSGQETITGFWHFVRKFKLALQEKHSKTETYKAVEQGETAQEILSIDRSHHLLSLYHTAALQYRTFFSL